MRVAVFTETFLPKIDGIVSILCLALQRLQTQGHAALVVGPPGMPAEFAGARCVGTNGPRFPLYPDVRMNMLTPAALQALREFRPDVVHVVNPAFLGPAGILYARARHLPLLASYHTDVPGYARAYGFPWAECGLWGFFRTLHNRADLNLVPSTAVLRQVRAHGFQRVRWWRRGVDTRLFRPLPPDPALRARLSGNHPGDFLLLYVGRVAKEKGLDRLAEPLRELAGARLAIVGGGPELPQMRERFRDSPAVFAGFLRGDELAQAYSCADALIFPSTNETIGLVALEAMACGLPVIAPMRGGLVDILRDEHNALVYDPDQPPTLLAQVRRLQHDADLRARLSAGALAHARGRGWEATMDQLIGYYALAQRWHWRWRHKR